MWPNNHQLTAAFPRPNTSLSFRVYTTSNLPLPNTNTLNVGGLTRLLRNYPDLQFVHTLIAIAQHGAQIGCDGPHGCTRQPNHSSGLMHADVITKSIQLELDKGRIRQISTLPPYYFCSPIGLTPKKTDGIQTGWRVIFDLSSPTGASVNDGIAKEHGTISYECLDIAKQLVAEAGRGAIVMKRDLKSAFRHIPISPLDYWLLIFEWNGIFYVDMFLPFGLRTAPKIFNLFSEALHWVFETLFKFK